MFVDQNGVIEGSTVAAFSDTTLIQLPFAQDDSSEHWVSNVSCILLSYDRVENDIHPVAVSYYAEDVGCSVEFMVKVSLMNEELEQELVTSIKLGKEI